MLLQLKITLILKTQIHSGLLVTSVLSLNTKPELYFSALPRLALKINYYNKNDSVEGLNKYQFRQ